MYIIYSSWELHYFECRRKSRCYSPPSSSKSNGLLVSILFYFFGRSFSSPWNPFVKLRLYGGLPSYKYTRHTARPLLTYGRYRLSRTHSNKKERKREKTGKRASAIPTIYKWARHVISPVSLVAHCFLFLFLFFFWLLFYVYPGICDDNEIEKRLADDRVRKERKTIEDFRIKILIFCCWVIDKTTAAYMLVEARNNAHRDGEIQPTLSAINRAPLPYIHPLPVTINRARVAAYIYAFDCTLPTSKKQNFAVQNNPLLFVFYTLAFSVFVLVSLPIYLPAY